MIADAFRASAVVAIAPAAWASPEMISPERVIRQVKERREGQGVQVQPLPFCVCHKNFMNTRGLFRAGEKKFLILPVYPHPPLSASLSSVQAR